jgi:hypothetical protein
MADAAEPSEHVAAEVGDHEDVEVADVSGGAVPEQLLEDDEGDGPARR